MTTLIGHRPRRWRHTRSGRVRAARAPRRWRAPGRSRRSSPEPSMGRSTTRANGSVDRRVRRDEHRSVKHLTNLLGDHDVDMVADEAMRHAVADRVDVDQGVERHAALSCSRRGSARPATGAASRARRARSGRSALRGSSRGAADRRRHPRGQVLLERGEGVEGLIRQRVALDVFHARFGLALRPRAIRCTRARLDVPVATEGEVGRVEDHGPCRAVTRSDQGRALSPRSVRGTPPKWVRAAAIPCASRRRAH